MQAPSRVDEDHIHTTGPGCLQRIVGDGRRISALLGTNDLHTSPLRPYIKLGNGAGTERVTGGQQDLVTRLSVALSEFADRRRLADAIHADNEDHVGSSR